MIILIIPDHLVGGPVAFFMLAAKSETTLCPSPQKPICFWVIYVNRNPSVIGQIGNTPQALLGSRGKFGS